MIYALITYFTLNIAYTYGFIRRSFVEEYKEDKACAIFLLISFLFAAYPCLIYLSLTKQNGHH